MHATVHPLPLLCVMGGLPVSAMSGHPSKDMALAWHQRGGTVLYCEFASSRWFHRELEEWKPGFWRLELPCCYGLPWSYPDLWRRIQVARSGRLLSQALAHLATPPASAIFLYYGWFWPELPGRIGDGQHVYDCIDESTEFPHIAGNARRVAYIQQCEARLIRAVDLVLTVSPALEERQGSQAERSAMLPNGINLDLWRGKAEPAQEEAAAQLGTLPRPCAALIGNLQNKLDLNLVAELAGRHPEWGFALIGAKSPGTQLPDNTRNLRHLNGVRQEQLPALLHFAEVGVVPLKNNAFNRASCPLKILEYLAAGLPVVSSRIPMSEYWRERFPDRIFLAERRDEWDDALTKAFACAQRLPALTDDQLADCRWTARAQALQQLCAGAR